MLSMLRRQNADTLIWEYLDGDITPRRCQKLTDMLRNKPKTRVRFVESAVLHGMLYAYYRDEQTGMDIDNPADADQTTRRKSGRTSAA